MFSDGIWTAYSVIVCMHKNDNLKQEAEKDFRICLYIYISFANNYIYNTLLLQPSLSTVKQPSGRNFMERYIVCIYMIYTVHDDFEPPITKLNIRVFESPPDKEGNLSSSLQNRFKIIGYPQFLSILKEGSTLPSYLPAIGIFMQ